VGDFRARFSSQSPLLALLAGTLRTPDEGVVGWWSLLGDFSLFPDLPHSFPFYNSNASVIRLSSSFFSSLEGEPYARLFFFHSDGEGQAVLSRSS